MKYIIILFIFFIFCQNKQQTNIIKVQEMSVEAKLKFKIVKEGKESALMDLESIFVNRGNMYCELLPYAKYLADQNNSGYGCEITSRALIAVCLFNYRDKEPQFPEYHHMSLLNDNEKKEIFFYLEKGASLKHNGCLIFLRELYKHGYGVKIDKSKSNFYNSKINY